MNNVLFLTYYSTYADISFLSSKSLSFLYFLSFSALPRPNNSAVIRSVSSPGDYDFCMHGVRGKMISRDPPHPGSDASPGVLVLCGIRHIRLLSWNFEYHRADTAMAIGLCIMGQTKNTISISRLSFNKPPDTDETFGERYGISTYLSIMLQTLYLVAVQRVRRLYWKITCNTCHIPQLTSMNFRPDLKILVVFSVCL